MKDLEVLLCILRLHNSRKCPFICPPGRVKRVMFYMMLSFIMYELVEADALISTLVHPFGIFKDNLKMSDLEFC